MAGIPQINASLSPVSPGATRISKTIDVPVNQEIRIQKREIRVPQFNVVEKINRTEKIKEIVRVVEKKVIVEQIKVVDQVYHPKIYKDIDVHVPVFEYIDNPVQRTIVRYFARDAAGQNTTVAAVEKKNEKGSTLIRPNLKTYTVSIPVVNYRPIRKDRVFVPHREVGGKIVYKYVDISNKQELNVNPEDIIHQECKDPVIRQLNRYVPAQKVKSYYERPVPQAVPGPIQDSFVDDVAQILDPEVRKAYENWIAGGKVGKVQLNRVEYEIEYNDVPTVVDGPVTSVLPDVKYEITVKQVNAPIKKVEWRDVDDEEADRLGLPQIERAEIVAHAGDVVIVNPVPGQVTVHVLPTIVENGPARFVVQEQIQNGETKVEKQSFHFVVAEERADVNFKILESNKEISLVNGECDGALTAEEFEHNIYAIQNHVEAENRRILEHHQVNEHIAEANNLSIVNGENAIPPVFVPLNGPDGSVFMPPPHFQEPTGSNVQLVGPNGHLSDFVRIGSDGHPLAFTVGPNNEVNYHPLN